MKIFGPLYDRALRWAQHPRAPTYLTVLSFVEAIIFPVMPEVMLMPMCVAQPRQGWYFATLSVTGSLLGALVGYVLGHYAFELFKPIFDAMGMLASIESGISLLQEKMALSPWAVVTFLVLGGFMPIPMKVFTWASGIVGVPLPQYVLSMLIGRAKRVYLLAAVIRFGGARAAMALRRWIEPLGWIATGLVILLVGALLWKTQSG